MVVFFLQLRFVSTKKRLLYYEKTVYLVIVIILTVSVSSCGSIANIQKKDNDVAGYTLKNKKELMQQKVLNKKNRTLIALP